jgi:hypothetical protein
VFGYFLRRVDRRFQLDKAAGSLEVLVPVRGKADGMKCFWRWQGAPAVAHRNELQKQAWLRRTCMTRALGHVANQLPEQ